MDVSGRRLWVFGLCVAAALFVVAGVNLWQAQADKAAPTSLAYSQFLDDLEKGQIVSVTLAGQQIAGQFSDRTRFVSYAAGNDLDLVRELRSKHVTIQAIPDPDGGPSASTALLNLLPSLLIIAATALLIFRMPRAGTRGGASGQSKAKLLSNSHDKVTFNDVAGVDEAKDSLREIVDFLRDPMKFNQLGGRIPRGVLLVGPPGSGKTLLARSVAGEANVPFFSISGSDFVEMYVGIGAARVRAMFEEAKKRAPCIIFMDEIDAVGRKRGAGLGQGNDEREQTLNQLLVEMDGFGGNSGVILMAATNRPDVLDPALVRSGRFDREIVVDNPDVRGREQILQVHVRGVPLAADVDLALLARGTTGFSGADLMNLVNESALLAVRRSQTEVGMRELEDARDKITMGEERRSHKMSDHDRILAAYGEGGRIITASYLPEADPIHKATIVPRGRTRGMVQQLPDDERRRQTLEQLMARLSVTMARRAAEEMIFGRSQLSSGAELDIEDATKLARLMVTRWGLSEALGPVAYAANEEEVFLGHSVARQQNISEEDSRLIMRETRKIVEDALAAASRVLHQHREQLEMIAKSLLEQETLTGYEIKRLLSETPLTSSYDNGQPASLAHTH